MLGGLGEIALIYAVLAAGWWGLRRCGKAFSNFASDVNKPSQEAWTDYLAAADDNADETRRGITNDTAAITASRTTAAITLPKIPGQASTAAEKPERKFDFEKMLRAPWMPQSETAVRAADNSEQSSLTSCPLVLDDVRRYADRRAAEWGADSDALRELKGLIGLEGVKVQVEMIANLVWVDSHRKQKKMKRPVNTYHMVFTGNPGTGKTTVARIVGRIFRDMGLLKNGEVIEVTRKDLGGQYWGSGDEMTGKVLERALDNVLFIDEAYALHKGHAAREGDPLGDEIITTLLAGMENYRDRMIVIAAGYKEEMNHFLESNAGLKSRFKTVIDFPDYSAVELYEVFGKICSENDYLLAAGAQARAEQIIEGLHARRDKNFGNAREMRNFFEECRKRQASRLRATGKTGISDLMTLIANDIGPEPLRPKAQGAKVAEPQRSVAGWLPSIGAPPLQLLAGARSDDALDQEQAALEKENNELMKRLTELGGDIEASEKRSQRKRRKKPAGQIKENS